MTSAQLSTGQSGWTVSAAGIATKTGATVADFTAAIAGSTTAALAAFSDGTNTWVGLSDGSASTTSSDHMVELVGLTGITAVANAAATTTIFVA